MRWHEDARLGQPGCTRAVPWAEPGTGAAVICCGALCSSAPSHFPLDNCFIIIILVFLFFVFFFPLFEGNWDVDSNCILSQDIQTNLPGFFDQSLGYDGDWVEGLDGLDSDFFFLFLFLPISECSFLTTGCGFGLSSLFPLIHFPVRTWNCSQLVSQHNWEREKQPSVCARNKSGSGMLSKNKV